MSNLYSDGAPDLERNSVNDSKKHINRSSLTDNVSNKVSKVVQFEGLRGRSTRLSIIFRYFSYFLFVLTCSFVTQGATDGINNASGGGLFMLLSSSMIAVSGALSTMLYPNMRFDIVHRVRHYVFGIVCIPGTALALFLKAGQSWLGSGDTLASTLGAAGPIVFLATIVLPAFVFVKEMFGIKTLNRSKLDDEEAVLLWTRQDGTQR
ncbi:MAG: hypothetical protein ACKOW9_05020 [Candidatus Paceibacterota bacterium]